MIELSTPVTNVSANDTVHKNDEGLGEDDQLFYRSLKNDLDKTDKSAESGDHYEVAELF